MKNRTAISIVQMCGIIKPCALRICYAGLNRLFDEGKKYICQHQKYALKITYLKKEIVITSEKPSFTRGASLSSPSKDEPCSIDRRSHKRKDGDDDGLQRRGTTCIGQDYLFRRDSRKGTTRPSFLIDDATKCRVCKRVRTRCAVGIFFLFTTRLTT